MLDLTWSDDYVLGIDIIDKQHRQLFSYFEEIDDAIAMADRKTVAVVVNGLVNYAISHNTFEESLMEKANYPLTKAHRQIHQTFKARAEKYLLQLEAGGDPFKIAEQVKVYIGLWLISHVKHDDRDYVPYVKKIVPPKGSFIKRFFRKAAV